MARRTVLRSRHRTALFSLPQREADLLRHDTLSEEDLRTSGPTAGALPYTYSVNYFLR